MFASARCCWDVQERCDGGFVILNRPHVQTGRWYDVVCVPRLLFFAVLLVVSPSLLCGGPVSPPGALLAVAHEVEQMGLVHAAAGALRRVQDASIAGVEGGGKEVSRCVSTILCVTRFVCQTILCVNYLRVYV